MSLNTLDNIYYRTCQYVYDNEAAYDFSRFSLSQDGQGNITISYWNYSFDEPEYADLENIDYSGVVEYFAQQAELNKIINLANLSTSTINNISSPTDGMLVFDKTTNQLKVYYSNAWNVI